MDPKRDEELDRPDQNTSKEPAEGSREKVGGGVSNRPLDREEQEQRDVPPRGQTKDDAGKTAGGGSLGHNQPDDVKRETPPRNAPGSDRDPVMPEDDATLKTKL